MKATIRKWGNSYGILIPKKELEKRKMRDGQVVELTLEPQEGIKDLFGIMRSRRPVDDIAREIKEDSKHDVLLR